jgi:hypothetical protein
MFTSRNFKALLLLFISLLVFHTDARAQSGRAPAKPRPVPGMQPAPAPTPADDTRYEKVKVVVAEDLENFVKALNEQGRLGYRLEKTVSYEYRRYAAVLHLDPGHTYDYVADPMPEDTQRFGDPLSSNPRRGYALVHTYATTQCRNVEVPADIYDPNNTQTKQETVAEKGNILLFMRRDGVETQTKQYMVFKNIFTLDGGQKQELQADLDAAPPGFRPVSLLFTQVWPYSFNLTVVVERDLNEPNPSKVKDQVVKEVFGFEDKLNKLAAEGARYIGGGRNEFVKIALLERQAAGRTAYTFKDDHQYEKEFPKMLAAGNSYVGLMTGELKCIAGSQYFFQKLVFARGAGSGPAREYKVLKVFDRKQGKMTGLLPDAALSELRRHLAEGFRVRDVFYVNALYAILEKQAETPAPPAQTSAR